MDRIESARLGMALLTFAVAMAAVVIVGSNEMAAHNPVLDRIATEEAWKGCEAKARPVSDCGLDFESYELQSLTTPMAE